MFSPNYKITNKILQNIASISAGREAIKNAHLLPSWELALREEALVHRAHASTAIEGNKLSLEQVSKLAMGREIMAGRKDKQEVLNYIKVLKKIEHFAKKQKIEEKTLLLIHNIITKNVLEDPADSGRYRTKYVVIGNSKTGAIAHRPPENEEVPGLIQDLLFWVDQTSKEDIDPIIKAGIVHYEFERIHPFVDGNGRTGRVLATLVLYKEGFDIKRFFALDDFYDANRSMYYKAFQETQASGKLTGWLEYFTEGVAISVEAVRQKILSLSIDGVLKAKKGQIYLSQRQIKIVEHLKKTGVITNRKVHAILGVSQKTAYLDLADLTEKGVIKKIGQGRSVQYKLILGND